LCAEPRLLRKVWCEMSENAPKLVYQDESAQVYWNNEAKSIELIAKKFVTSAMHRAMLERVLQMIRDRRSQKFLADITLLGAVPNDDLAWAETNWVPRCQNAGLKCWAVVMPKSLAMHMSVEKISDRMGVATFTRKYFSDIESAREWLAQQ
jgi:SpoIIAA-like